MQSLKVGNGGASYDFGGDENFGLYNVAQNSVNYGFLSGAPLGAGIFDISLSAFQGTSEIASSSIRVYVDTLPAPVPLPAAGILLLGALGGLGKLRRRKKS